MATIVTAFYPLERSKHGVRKYIEWVRNFFQIPRPMVVYTNARMAPLLERIREGLPVTAPFRVITKEFDTFAMTTPARMEMWRRHWHLDPEARIHSPELYAVWAVKQECVALAIAEDPLGLGHDWYVWCDIGIQRHPEMQRYYDTFTDAIPSLCHPGAIHFLEVAPIPDSLVARRGEVPMPYPPPSVTLGGGCIAGDRAAWAAFSAAYITMLDHFEERRWFAGKDQIVFFAMLMEKVMPFRLFYSVRFGEGGRGDHWMSFPVILGGQTPARIDTRFVDSVQ
jgi:hypothetical protein